jgi:hypothetical protein
MTPEQKARQHIDSLLTQAGWLVQDFKQMNSYASLGVAVREFRLKSAPSITHSTPMGKPLASLKPSRSHMVKPGWLYAWRLRR